MTESASIHSGFPPNKQVAQTEATHRLTFWGTYDLSKPRTRILLDGLRKQSVEVLELHARIWPDHADKSQLSMRSFAVATIWALLCYPALIIRLFRSPRDAVLVVPYLGALDVLMLWPFAKLRGQRIVWDMFLSLYDTVVNDRKMVRRRHPVALALYVTEYLAARAADLVTLDTQAHADYVSRLYKLSNKKTAAIPVGAEVEKFPRLPPPRQATSATQILFYGQLIPLHGVETILEAARSPRGQAYHWHFIGTGQDQPKVEEVLSKGAMDHVVWEPWVEYDDLIDAIERSQICLGIFGTSEKAASVVPNKVYQALCAGRPVITRASAAIEETFGPNDALLTVPPADPEAILDAIEAHIANGFPAMPRDQLKIARSDVIGERFAELLNRSVQAEGDTT